MARLEFHNFAKCFGKAVKDISLRVEDEELVLLLGLGRTLLTLGEKGYNV